MRTSAITALPTANRVKPRTPSPTSWTGSSLVRPVQRSARNSPGRVSRLPRPSAARRKYRGPAPSRCWPSFVNAAFAKSSTGEILMHIELATCVGEDTPFDLSDEPSHLHMVGHSPDLKELLRNHGVVVVSAQYRGMDGRGGFDSLRFTTADGADGLVFDGPRNLQLKSMFRAILIGATAQVPTVVF